MEKDFDFYIKQAYELRESDDTYYLSDSLIGNLVYTKKNEEYKFFTSDKIKQLINNYQIDDLIIKYLLKFKCIKKYRLYTNIANLFEYEFVSKSRIYDSAKKLEKENLVISTNKSEEITSLMIDIEPYFVCEENMNIVNNGLANYIYLSNKLIRKNKIESVIELEK